MGYIKKNIFYSLLYQIITFIVPVITIPYISKTLGPNPIGQYSFTNSIMIYFGLLAGLGYGTYAFRGVATVRNNKRKLSVFFWEIIYQKLFTSLFAIIFFSVSLFFIDNSYISFFLFQITILLEPIIDVNWLFQGLEDFKTTVTRQIVVKLLGVTSIFIFVQQPQDIYIYILCCTIPNCLSLFVMWPKALKLIDYVPFNQLNIFSHLKGTIAVGVPYVAVLLFSYIDKTMLGLSLPDSIENGYYEQAIKIVSICIVMISSVSFVILPRITNVHVSGSTIKLRYYLLTAIKVVAFIGALISTVIFFISSNFVPWFMGDDFLKVSGLIKILAVLVFLKAVTNLIGSAYLIGTFKQKEYTTCIGIAAFTNIILNIFMIPSFFSEGAAIASVFSEILLLLLMIKYFRQLVNIKVLLLSIWKYIFVLVLLCLPGMWLSQFLPSNFIYSSLLGVAAIIFYLIVLRLLKDRLLIKVIRNTTSQVKSLFS